MLSFDIIQNDRLLQLRRETLQISTCFNFANFSIMMSLVEFISINIKFLFLEHDE